MMEQARAEAIHMTIPQHEQVYERAMDTIKRYWCGVNFLGHDAALPPRVPSSSCSSASTARSAQAPSTSSTRPPYAATQSALTFGPFTTFVPPPTFLPATMYVPRPYSFCTAAGTSPFVHSSLQGMLCCYLLMRDI